MHLLGEGKLEKIEEDGEKSFTFSSLKILLNRPIEDAFISSHDNWRESTASNKGRLRKGMRIKMRAEKEVPRPTNRLTGGSI